MKTRKPAPRTTWTPAQLKILRDFYPIETREQVSARMGTVNPRSPSSCGQMAMRLCIDGWKSIKEEQNKSCKIAGYRRAAETAAISSAREKAELNERQMELASLPFMRIPKLTFYGTAATPCLVMTNIPLSKFL